MSQKKILYALNGTGSGHITRAREFIPYLKQQYDVDILISGCNYVLDTKLDIKYNFKGFTFVINKSGRVSYLRSILGNNLIRFIIDVLTVDIKAYDLIISDFEPISAWASKLRNKPSLQLSHQSALFSDKTPRPIKKDRLAEFFIKWYSPCKQYIGFHFKEYDKNIYKPLLRNKIIEANPTVKDYYVIYLWNYSVDYIVNIVSDFKDYRFKIFDSNTSEKYNIGNCEVQPTSDNLFFESILECKGVICGAGFELPAEILYLKKKLYVIPIGNQYEQKCNAEALIQMGVDSYEKLEKNNLLDWLKKDFTEKDSLKVSSPKDILNSIKTYF